MKKFLIVLLGLILFSCSDEIEFQGNAKMIIKGKVLDNQNLPLSNKDVYVNIIANGESNGLGPSQNFEDILIGINKTNQQGEYVFAFPKPSNFDEIVITINNQEDTYTVKEISNIKIHNFSDYLFNAPTVALQFKNDFSKLKVTLNQTNSLTALQNIEYIGNIYEQNIFINPLDIDGLYYNLNKLVKKNQPLILRYTVYNFNTSTTSVIDEIINVSNNDTTNFTLNY